MLINEYRLTPIEPEARKFLEKEMEKYFFGKERQFQKNTFLRINSYLIGNSDVFWTVRIAKLEFTLDTPGSCVSESL